EQSRRKIVLSTQIQAIEEQLAAQNGMPFSELLGEAQAEDRDSLTGRISDWASHIEVLENQRLELVRGSERLQGELRQMDGSAQAAFALQRGQEALARIRGGAEEYVRLKLSAVLLRRAIEIYRERNQGPVLKRAGEFFSVLTCGAFARLDTDFGEDDSLLLVGVRNPGPGERVSIEGMSAGTLDQLYLALRLAAIDRYLETNEAIPLIIDDILIQFDEERSSATLRVLWELSQKTQVLLFTHHRHLLDLARRHIAPEAVVIHELEPRYPA
ncbi:MAG TPA: chromosome segregation protein SMC, partial [Gammaproteobacteria bacterium]|nr:chromosome segregation protein SMC [Gammaproteobacteria bacterium]